MSDNETTTMWEQYQNGLAYQAEIELTKRTKENVDFYEGRQWAPVTERTKSLPRPVVNITKFICRNKRALLSSVPIKLVYKTDTEGVSAEKFTRFADYIQKEMKMAELDARAIKDGVVKGSFFYHFYWDSEAKGKLGEFEGGLRGEIIDLRNIFFSNPQEPDEQKQKWVIIASREEVSAVKEKADKKIDKALIVADDAEENDIEQEGTEMCTVLTKYSREKGEVFCEKGVKGTIVNKAFPISPDVELAKKKLGFDDAPNNSLPDDALKQKAKPKLKATLYPIVAGSYEEKEKCIYGMSEVEDIIPNQKAINFDLAMQLLANENLAWGKFITTPDALRNQKINNEPGQHLIDYSKTGNGIRKLEAHAMSNAPINMVNTVTEMTRVVTGSTEVMTGEALGANMSGAAIAQLQSQANRPVEEQRDRFWKVKERQGKVLEQFFKLYYEGKKFNYTETEKNKKTNEDEETTINDTFNGSEYQDQDFEVIVEATSGTRSSAAGDINFIDSLFAKGYIDVTTYVKAYPSDVLSDKSKIEKLVAENQGNREMAMQKQLQEAQAQLEQAAQLLEKQSAVINNVTTVVKENNTLRAEYIKLAAEAIPKINAANKMASNYGEVASDAKLFAELYARESGMIPTQTAQAEGNTQG